MRQGTRPRTAERRAAAPEQGADHLAPLARARCLLDQPERLRVAPGQPGDHPAALPAGGAVHRAEQAELGVLPGGDGSGLDHPLVEVGAPRGAGQGAVAAHPGQHARLELGHVGDDEHPALVGHGRRPHLDRERQGAAAVGRPPSRRRPGGLVDRAEPAVADPLVDPRPAVGREQVGEGLVAQQRLDDRVVDGAQRRRPGVGDLDPGPAQGGQQVGSGVRVEAGGVEEASYVVGALREEPRARAAGRAGAEPLGQQRLVDVDAPRHTGVGHLGGREGACGLRRDEEPEPGGLGGGVDRRQLARVLDVGAQVVERVVPAEQRRAR